MIPPPSAAHRGAPRSPRRGYAHRAGVAAAAFVTLALTLALIPAGGAGAVPYILYHHVFGQWSVVCWRDLAGSERSCYMDAPPSSLDQGGRTGALRIAEPEPGRFLVTVSARSGTARGSRVVLRVDSNPPHERGPDALDHVAWDGEAAAAIVGELRQGRRLTLEFPDARADKAKKLVIPLDDFTQAFAAFRDNLQTLGAPAP